MKRIARLRGRPLNVLVHNLSGFDGIFLLKIVSKLKQPTILKNGGRIISITIPVLDADGNKVASLIFKDSLQMLPVSLGSLANTFGLGNKDVFDFRGFNKLMTEGLSPSKTAIAQFKNYNKKDCTLLFGIWSIFQRFIHGTFAVNINDFSTLSGLAFGIYRTCFLKDKNVNINITSNEIDRNIRPGYTGGHVDVYKTHGFNL